MSWSGSASRVCLRAAASSLGETNSRSRMLISRIRKIPPRYSPIVNCHPSRTQMTRPSSQTRLVEANWNASITAAEAPLENSERPMAMAA